MNNVSSTMSDFFDNINDDFQSIEIENENTEEEININDFDYVIIVDMDHIHNQTEKKFIKNLSNYLNQILCLYDIAVKTYTELFIDDYEHNYNDTVALIYFKFNKSVSPQLLYGFCKKMFKLNEIHDKRNDIKILINRIKNDFSIYYFNSYHSSRTKTLSELNYVMAMFGFFNMLGDYQNLFSKKKLDKVFSYNDKLKILRSSIKPDDKDLIVYLPAVYYSNISIGPEIFADIFPFCTNHNCQNNYSDLIIEYEKNKNKELNLDNSEQIVTPSEDKPCVNFYYCDIYYKVLHLKKQDHRLSNVSYNLTPDMSLAPHYRESTPGVILYFRKYKTEH